MEHHDYEPGDTTHPMSTDPDCRVCGETRRACERRGKGVLKMEKQLIRDDDGVIFDVLGTKTNGYVDSVWLKRANDDHPASGPWSFGREALERDFTAYPPQQRPAEQVADIKPLRAYRVTFCPIDNVALQPGHQVSEASGWGPVNAEKCPACGRVFGADSLNELTTRKD